MFNRGFELGHIIHLVPDIASIKTAYDAFCSSFLDFAQDGEVGSKLSLGKTLKKQRS